jgi:antitoxin HicB
VKFNVILKPDLEDGGYNISCPALPGCHSQGETEQEAVENIKEAIIGCLETLNLRAMNSDKKGKVLEVAIN